MKKPLAVLVAACGLLLSSAVIVFAADAVPGAAAKATDVSGTWNFVVETAQGSGAPVFTLRQAGAKITGTYKGQFGEAPVTGTINGDAIAISVTVNVGEALQIEYSGTVQGGAMKGTVKFGSEGDGTFTAKRK